MKNLFNIVMGIALLHVGCATTLPPSFMRTYDEPGVWKSVEVREGLSKDEVWRTVVDAVAQKFDLEVIENESGYLRTSWKYTYILPQSETVSDRYRSRIILKFVGEDWKVLQVKCESHWLEPGTGWITGYDSRLLEDTFGDLQGRIGRVRR